MASPSSSSVHSRDPPHVKRIWTSVLQSSSLVPGVSEVNDDRRPIPSPQNGVSGVDAIAQQVLRLDGTEPCHHVAGYPRGLLFSDVDTRFELLHADARNIFANESLDDVGDGMKRSRLREDVKADTQQAPCRTILSPQTIPRPILPKFSVTSVVEIVYGPLNQSGMVPAWISRAARRRWPSMEDVHGTYPACPLSAGIPEPLA
ncbi:hypothetical protein EDD85DRAFT_955058 [Armillaria nabsnona]|nr:hypothetical protein EDD85DRAFT_955058 [Armillaria nabsnona]